MVCLPLKHPFRPDFLKTVKGGMRKSDNTPIKTISIVVPLSSSTSKTSKITSGCQVIRASIKNYGVLNKGNTCYISATLQCFSIKVQFWSSFNAVSKALSPTVSSFVKIMYLLKSSKLRPSSIFGVLEARPCKIWKATF